MANTQLESPTGPEQQGYTDIGSLRLNQLLGVWKYERPHRPTKYWAVLPAEDGMFSISWASSMETLGVKELSLVEAPEACRRVVSKMRGGYTLVKAATQTFPNGEVLVKDLVEDCDTRPMRGYRVWERMGSAALRRGAAALTEWLKG